MREGRETQIPIPGVSTKVFLAFLEFLYTDDVLLLNNTPLSSMTRGLTAIRRPPAPNNAPTTPSSSPVKGGARSSSSGSTSEQPHQEREQPLSHLEHLSFAMDLLSLADQYLLEALKRKCEQAILRGVTASNVAEVLATADAQNAIDLRRRCIDYILANFPRVIATPNFAELPGQLLHEVLVEASRRGVQCGMLTPAMRPPSVLDGDGLR